MIAYTFWALAASFLIGAIPTAYLAGRYLRGIDLRKAGSGNVGATNALRVMGKGIGLSVFAVDFCKGFLPTLSLPTLMGFAVIEHPSFASWIGLAAILGHIFTPFLGFKGGKGVATGAGVTCAINAPFFLVSISIWALVFITSRAVSIASILAVGSLVLMSYVFKNEWPTLPFFALLFGLSLWTHRENMRRIFQGKESRFN